MSRYSDEIMYCDKINGFVDSKTILLSIPELRVRKPPILIITAAKTSESQQKKVKNSQQMQ